MAKQVKRAECILVADGEVLVRHAIADYLRHCGYRVVEAATTDEAINILKQGEALPDAVLCDAQCPGTVNAFQLRAWVQREVGQVPVMLAGSVEVAAAKAAELCEKGPQLARPYDPQSVVNRVRRVLGERASGKRAGG